MRRLPLKPLPVKGVAILSPERREVDQGMEPMLGVKGVIEEVDRNMHETDLGSRLEEAHAGFDRGACRPPEETCEPLKVTCREELMVEIDDQVSLLSQNGAG